LGEVTPQIGPLIFLKGGSGVTPVRLRFKYDKYQANEFGSWRLPGIEFSLLGLEKSNFIVKESTLVIANTMGFHCRGEAVKGVSKGTIHFSARVSLF